MLNQEQLAAIAAAMSFVQQTLQQNQLQSGPNEQTLPQPQPPQPSQPPAQEVVKASQPISYSAVVAKSAGLMSNSNTSNNTNTNQHSNNNHHHNIQATSTITTTNNNNGSSQTNSNIIHNNNSILTTATNGTASTRFANNINDNALDAFGISSHNKLTGPTVDCNPFGALDHAAAGVPISASSNHLSRLNGSDPLTVFNNFNGINSLNGHKMHPGQLNVPNPILRYSLNHITTDIINQASTDSSDIFSSASGFDHTNGSSLLTNRNSNNIMAPEPTLDNYAINHPTIPAHQLYSKQNNSFRQNQMPSNLIQLQQNQKPHPSNTEISILGNQTSRDKHNSLQGRATNLLGFMGLYVGNLSPDLTKEQLEKIFSKYGQPVKAHRLIRSPVAFIKYENTESPRAAIDDLFGVLLPELTLNQDQPLKLHFDRNDVQLKANYRPTELPKEDNGECYGWRTTVCRRGKSCTKKHIPINRGIDFQMWMIKTNLTTVTGTTAS